MHKLTDWALGNRLLVITLALGVIGGGYTAYRQVPIDSFPDVTPTMVQIFTSSPGLAPDDVETLISYPVEISMYGLPGLERVQSTSIFGLSRVNVYFEDGMDIYFARRLVMEQLAQAREEIPPGLGEPQLGPITTGLGQVLLYELKAKPGAEYSLRELRTIQDWTVKPMLRTVPGVTDILSIGGFVKQYQVRPKVDALLARNLTLQDLHHALAANNRNVGASFIERGGEEYIIRGYGWIAPGEKGLEELRNIMVTETHGTPVLIRDVAQVAFGDAIRRGALVVDGQESVGAYVLRLIGTNTQQLIERIEAKLEAVKQALPEGVSLDPFYTQATLVNKAVGTVQEALAMGITLVIIALYLFLGNLRSTLMVMVSLPFSVLIAFIAMDLTGMSANLMSLGGLAIAIGMVVDGSVVMLENIFRHLQEQKEKTLSLTLLISEAGREVARPIAFAVAIIIIVFLPLFTLQGVEGKLFKPMAYTISFALLGALLVALMLVPVLARLGLSAKMPLSEPRLVRIILSAYQPLLRKAVHHPFWVIGLAIFLFASSLALFPRLGTEFVPTLREGTILVRSTLPPGANLSKAINYAHQIQAEIGQFPEVTGTFSRVGRAEVGGDPEPVNVVATVVQLKALETWNRELTYENLQSEIAKELETAVPGLANNVSQPIQLRTDELLSGVKAQVVVSLYGEDLETLAALGHQVEDIIREVDGAVDVRMQQQTGKPQIVIRPDRTALARYGVSVDELLNTVETGIGGSTVGQVFENIRRFDVFLRLEETDRTQLSQIRQLPFRTAAGAMVPLSRLADVEIFIGPKMISRSQASRRLFVQLNVRGQDMGSVVREIQQRIHNEVKMPAGYFVDYGGQFKNQRRAMERLYIVIPVTLGLIFLLLYITFHSLRYATLIFLNVPFAAIGGLVALFLSGLYLSVPAAVGFITVFGVAVLNGVVLVSYINELRHTGKGLTDAVLLGATRRGRPVLMTATTSILGLIPVALASGIGSNVQRPLAVVVIGGLVTSTLLTLVVLPSLYRGFAGND